MINIIDNDLLSIQEARILAENAAEAHKKLAAFSQEKLDSIVESFADVVETYIPTLATMSHEETGYGIPQDKAIKNTFVCQNVRQQLRGMRCVGFIRDDRRQGICQVGVSRGVIVSLCPSTSPVSTTLHNVLIALKSGNAIIFSPHLRARKTIGFLLDILIEQGQQLGIPENTISYLHTVTKSGTTELIKNPASSLILNTGVPGFLDVAYATKKPVIYGGAGNGPVFIERTADISKAAKDIVTSKSFDNGLLPSTEQSVVVDAPVAQQVRDRLRACGGYFMSEFEAGQLAAISWTHQGKYQNRQIVGSSALELAKISGFSVPEDTRILIAERQYVTEEDTFLQLRYCPVLAFYIEEDWQNACEKCIELLISERNSHTLVIHSRDENVISQFALKKPVARVLVNTPASLGGIGLTTSLSPSLTLGSGLSGEGITADNVSPLNLISIRQVGYGIRDMEAIQKLTPEATIPGSSTTTSKDMENIKILYEVLKQTLEKR